MENYLENNYGDEFEVTDNIENYWENRSNDNENLEEKYYFPQNKFIKMCHFEIIADKIKVLEPTDETADEAAIQEEVLLALWDHPFGDSKWLDKAYGSLYDAIEAKHQELVDLANRKAQEQFQVHIKFQLEERQPSCPVCFGEEFETCTHFYRCKTCKGSVCADCGPLLPRKCPMCNIRLPMQHIKLDTYIQKEHQTLPHKKTVRDLMTEIMYRCKPDSLEKVNLFGQNIEGFENFKMASLSPEEFDYELAEFLRLSRDLLQSMLQNKDTEYYREEVATHYWWCLDLEPYLTGRQTL